MGSIAGRSQKNNNRGTRSSPHGEVARKSGLRYDGVDTEVTPVNQALLRKMATERLLDAQALLAAGRWPFAYYVAGYAVECALKACVLAQMVNTGWVFKEKVEGKD